MPCYSNKSKGEVLITQLEEIVFSDGINLDVYHGQMIGCIAPN